MERATARFKRTLLAVLVIAAVSPSTATAGTYTVVGGCGNWTPRYGPPKQMAVYGDCSVLVVRNVGGAFMTPWGTTAEWQFLPPPRTVIGAVSMSGTFHFALPLSGSNAM